MTISHDAYLDIETTGLSCEDAGITVEQRLGIPRRLQDINGWDAVRLWWRYMDYGDLDALTTLLEYNREDVMNLKVLRDKVGMT